MTIEKVKTYRDNVPGGVFGGAQDDPLIQNITNTVNNVVEVVNEQGDTITNNFYLGGGGVGSSSYQVIAHTENEQTNRPDSLMNGYPGFRLTHDNQMVVIWRIQTGGSYGIYGMKSAAPYTTWTNLQGTSASPSLIGTVADINTPIWAQELGTGSLVVTYSNATDTYYSVCSYSGGAWTPSGSFAAINSGIGEVGDIYASPSVPGTIILVTSKQIPVPGTPADWLFIYRGIVQGTSITWSLLANIRSVFATTVYSYPKNTSMCGVNKRFVPVGDGLLLLWDWGDISSIGANYAYRTTIGWAFSPNGGHFWDIRDDGSGNLRGWGFAGSYTGNLHSEIPDPPTACSPTYGNVRISPQSGGGSGANVIARHSYWDACYLSGDRVAVAYTGMNDSVSGSQTAGVRYIEWKISNNGGNGGFDDYTTAPLIFPSTRCLPLSIRSLAGNPFVFMSTHALSGVGTSAASGMAEFNRLLIRGNPSAPDDILTWPSAKQIWRTDGTGLISGGNSYLVGDVCPLRDGAIVVDNQSVFPVLFSQIVPSGNSTPSNELMLKYFPVGQITATI